MDYFEPIKGKQLLMIYNKTFTAEFLKQCRSTIECSSYLYQAIKNRTFIGYVTIIEKGYSLIITHNYFCDKLHGLQRIKNKYGSIESEYWYKYGKLHRKDGPAIIKDLRNKIKNEYWENGIFIRKEYIRK